MRNMDERSVATPRLQSWTKKCRKGPFVLFEIWFKCTLHLICTLDYIDCMVVGLNWNHYLSRSQIVMLTPNGAMRIEFHVRVKIIYFRTCKIICEVLWNHDLARNGMKWVLSHFLRLTLMLNKIYSNSVLKTIKTWILDPETYMLLRNWYKWFPVRMRLNWH